MSIEFAKIQSNQIEVYSKEKTLLEFCRGYAEIEDSKMKRTNALFVNSEYQVAVTYLCMQYLYSWLRMKSFSPSSSYKEKNAV